MADLSYRVVIDNRLYHLVPEEEISGLPKLQKFDDPGLEAVQKFEYKTLPNNKKRIRLLRLKAAASDNPQIYCELVEADYDNPFHIPTNPDRKNEDYSLNSSTTVVKEDDTDLASLEESKESDEDLAHKDSTPSQPENESDETKRLEAQYQEVKKYEIEYEALSWCWGNEPENYAIIIEEDGRYYKRSIKKGLALALKYLRHTNRSRTVWIDSICINQNDDNERNHQVQMMSRIYTRAKQVCIWLGEGNADSKSAIDFIRHEIMELKNFDSICSDKQYASKWQALMVLMQRPWFSRRWMVQEISLAREATIYCGPDEINWKDFAVAVELFVEVETATHRLSEVMQKDEKFRHIPGWFEHVSELGASLLVQATGKVFRTQSIDRSPPDRNGFEQDTTNQNSMIRHHNTIFGDVPTIDPLERRSLLSLQYLVTTMFIFQTSEPRDVIYSLLAVARDASPYAEKSVATDKEYTLFVRTGFSHFLEEKPFKVDYARPYSDVCRDFVEFSIQRSLEIDGVQALDILCRPWALEPPKDKSDRIKETPVLKKIETVVPAGTYVWKQIQEEKLEESLKLKKFIFHLRRTVKKMEETNDDSEKKREELEKICDLLQDCYDEQKETDNRFKKFDQNHNQERLREFDRRATRIWMNGVVENWKGQDWKWEDRDIEWTDETLEWKKEASAKWTEKIAAKWNSDDETKWDWPDWVWEVEERLKDNSDRNNTKREDNGKLVWVPDKQYKARHFPDLIKNDSTSRDQEQVNKGQSDKTQPNPKKEQRSKDSDETPDDIKLPSWIPLASSAPFGLFPHPGMNIEKTGRINADPLVGLPQDGHRNYNAAQTRSADLASLKFRKRPLLGHYSLYVKGFIFDEIQRVEDASQNGSIPASWLELGGWNDAQKTHPPDEFWRTLVADRGKDNRNPPYYYARACSESAIKGGLRSGGINTTALINDECNSIIAEFCRRVQAVIWNRCLFKTAKAGILGLASDKVREGDKVAIIYGCTVPVILREYNNKTDEDMIRERFDDYAESLKAVIRKCEEKRIRKLRLIGKGGVADDVKEDTKEANKRLKEYSRISIDSEESRKRLIELTRKWEEEHSKKNEPQGKEPTGNQDQRDDGSTESSDGSGESSQKKSKRARNEEDARRMDPGRYYILMGESYVHGMMDGEALRKRFYGDIADQIFELR